MSREAIPNDQKTREQIIQVIQNQFDLELLLKQREITTIEGELAHGEKLIGELREAISAGIQLAAGNDAQNPKNIELGESSPVTKGGKGKNAERKSYDALYSRRADGTFVKLSCPECGRTKFLNQQGFINHCRISHELEFSSHEQSNYLCGTPVDESEVPLDHPCRRRIATHSLATIFTNGGGLGSMERKLNDEMKDQLSNTLSGMQKPTIKVFEEDVDLDNDEPSSAQPRLPSKSVKNLQSKSAKSTPLRASLPPTSSSSSSSSSSSCSSSSSDSDSSASFNFGKRRRSILSKYPRKRDQTTGEGELDRGYSGKTCRKYYRNAHHESSKHPKYSGKMPTKHFSGKRMNVNTEIKEESEQEEDEDEDEDEARAISHTVNPPSRKSIAIGHHPTGQLPSKNGEDILNTEQTGETDNITESSILPSILSNYQVVSANNLLAPENLSSLDAAETKEAETLMERGVDVANITVEQRSQSSDFVQATGSGTNHRNVLGTASSSIRPEESCSDENHPHEKAENKMPDDTNKALSGEQDNSDQKKRTNIEADVSPLLSHKSKEKFKENGPVEASESNKLVQTLQGQSTSFSDVQNTEEMEFINENLPEGNNLTPEGFHDARISSPQRLDTKATSQKTFPSDQTELLVTELVDSSNHQKRKNGDIEVESQSQPSFSGTETEPKTNSGPDSNASFNVSSQVLSDKSTSNISPTSTSAPILTAGIAAPNHTVVNVNDSEENFADHIVEPDSTEATFQTMLAVGNKTSITSLPTYDSYASSLRRILSATNNQHHGSRFYIKKRVIVGNVSKFIPISRRKRGMEHYSHKWMVYVEFPTQEKSQDFISKVRVFLHPSYKPHDVVDLEQPPFRLTRHAWGEFPIRLQLHFYDPRNKPVDIIHQLKLDDVRTGRQVLGGERFYDLELDRNTVFGKEGRLVEMINSGSFVQTVNGLCKICGTNHQATSDHPNYLLGRECKAILDEINCGIQAFSSLTSSSELGHELGDDWEADVDHDDELDIDIDDDFSTSSFTSTAKDIATKATQTQLYQDIITLETMNQTTDAEHKRGIEWIWKTIDQLNLPGTIRLTSSHKRQKMKLSLNSHVEEQRDQVGNLLLEVGKIFLTRLTKRTLQIQETLSIETDSQTDHQNPMYDKDYDQEDKSSNSWKSKNLDTPKNMLTPLHLVQALLNHPGEYDFLTNEYLLSQR